MTGEFYFGVMENTGGNYSDRYALVCGDNEKSYREETRKLIDAGYNREIYPMKRVLGLINIEKGMLSGKALGIVERVNRDERELDFFELDELVG